MVEDALIGYLIEAVQRLQEEVKEGLETGGLETYQRAKIQRNIEGENEDGGYTYQTGVVAEERLVPNQARDLIDDVIVGTRVHSSIVDELQPRLGLDEETAEEKIDQVLRSLVLHLFERGGEGDPSALGGTLLKDLEKSAVWWTTKTFLTGVKVSGDSSINIGPGATLREPQPEDLESQWTPGGLTADSTDLFFKDSILVLRAYKAQPGEVQRAKRAFLGLLRLYDVGTAVPSVTERNAESVMRGGEVTRHGNGAISPYSYTLSKEDEPLLHLLHERIFETLKDLTWTTTGRDLGAVELAFNRYEDALESNDVEARIATSIACLEALLLKADERGELSRRLSQRAGVLLGLAGHRPIEVQRKIQEAYQIRSHWVHGSSLPEDADESARDLSEEVTEYARLTLVLSLQLFEEKEKEALISSLDNGLLKDKSLQRLEDDLEEMDILIPPIDQHRRPSFTANLDGSPE